MSPGQEHEMRCGYEETIALLARQRNDAQRDARRWMWTAVLMAGLFVVAAVVLGW